MPYWIELQVAVQVQVPEQSAGGAPPKEGQHRRRGNTEAEATPQRRQLTRCRSRFQATQRMNAMLITSGQSRIHVTTHVGSPRGPVVTVVLLPFCGQSPSLLVRCLKSTGTRWYNTVAPTSGQSRKHYSTMLEVHAELSGGSTGTCNATILHCKVRSTHRLLLSFGYTS